MVREMCVKTDRTAAPVAQSNVALAARNATAMSSSSDFQTERDLREETLIGAVVEAVANWFRSVLGCCSTDRATR
jgi:hypothetical protein